MKFTVRLKKLILIYNNAKNQYKYSRKIQNLNNGLKKKKGIEKNKKMNKIVTR